MKINLRIPFFSPGGTRHRRGAYGIHPVASFQDIIERERGRSDRNSHGFSLAVFTTPSHAEDDERVAKLVRVLVAKARFTDEVGWMGKTDIGVLLTETNVDGARIFVDRVRWVLSNPGPAPECRVYEYPRDVSMQGDESGPKQLWFNQLLDYREASPLGAAPVAGSENAEPNPASDTAGASLAVPAPPNGAPEVAVCGSVEDAVDSYMMPRPPLWKRILDFTGSLIALIVFAPVMLLIALFIKCVSPGPVLFKQERVGFRGKPFTCWKFRTMHLNCDVGIHQNHLKTLINSEAPMTKLESEGRDPRLIPFGGILRQCALDELPQLLNVVRGEMSLIGPRPCIPYEYQEYRRWQKRRVEAPPGMTGLWQVSGKNRTTFNEMMRLDINYATKKSPWLDFMIVFKTIPAIIMQVKDSAAKRSSRNPVSALSAK